MELFNPWLHYHTRIESEENSIDPDDGNSWVCSACRLPIFSTPFQISYQRSKKNAKLLLHDECASLPEKLIDHPLHPREALHLVKNEDFSSISCDKCREECGSLLYRCYNFSCGLRLDLLCSLPMIKILHRSHKHRLMVIRGSASFICGACGTQHQGRLALSYFCSACNFWIHKDCASLPNVIKLLHHKHQHSLFLTYDRSSSSSVSSSSYSKCAICGDALQSLGVYLCVKCGYYVHIRCATSDPHSFQPVLIRDAKLADLLHLPMEDEHTNIVQYMLENTSAVDDEAEEEQEEEHEDDDDGCRHDPKLKKHSLIFHDEDEDVSYDDDYDGTGHSSRVCKACIQFILPPFYSCSKCRDFLLHSCCADLPRKIHHPIHPEHTLFLFSKSQKSSLHLPGFNCSGCGHLCSGFGYSCETCSYFKVDVVCALMPPSITHESHGKTHILHMSRKPNFSYSCSCCMLDLNGIFYECSNCRHLKLHAHCALLPTTVSHKFDKHPLKLTTSPKISLITTTTTNDDDSEEEMQHFCAVCETDIKERCWYYTCKQCDQSFHIACIPFLDRFSRNRH
ncbi:hypothetical protein C2S52_018795 [Perilla frutescens var. hirtella]|nr:hypothetical protein C2S52_018795 [Perilla frutescens var. hirtella]